MYLILLMWWKYILSTKTLPLHMNTALSPNTRLNNVFITSSRMLSDASLDLEQCLLFTFALVLWLFSLFVLDFTQNVLNYNFLREPRFGMKGPAVENRWETALALRAVSPSEWGNQRPITHFLPPSSSASPKGQECTCDAYGVASVHELR